MAVIKIFRRSFRGVLSRYKIFGIIALILFSVVSYGAESPDSFSASDIISSTSSGNISNPVAAGFLVDRSDLVLRNALEVPVPAPDNFTACEGGSATFSVVDPGPYQWEVSTNSGGSWSTLAGQTSPTLVLNPVTLGMSGNQYRCQVNGTPSTSALLLVNANPVLSSSLTPPAICSNSLFNYSPTSASPGAAFSWTRAAVAGISNPASSGTTNPNEVLTNTTALPISVTYRYTLTANGCSNTQDVVVSVNPAPVLTSSLSPAAICSNSAFSYNPTSSTAVATFNWSRAAIAGITNPAASGTNSPNETLVNSTTAPISVTYQYTLTAYGCNNIQNVVVAVNPLPVLTSTLTPAAICSNSVFGYVPVSSISVATFSWTRATVAGISNSSSSGTGNPNETLINTSGSPVSVEYIYTVSANGCTNPSTFTVTVTVNPTPSLASSLTPPAICSNSVFSYNPTSSTSGVSFSWSRASVVGISNPAASGMAIRMKPLLIQRLHL